MSFKRIMRVFMKDLRLGPRSPIFLFVILMPAVMTVIFQLVFGNLFSPEPRLGIVDMGNSEVAALAEELDGFQVVKVDNEKKLKQMVKDNDLDAGLVLKKGFDKELRSGEKPRLQFYMGGETRASDRVILSVATLELVRDVEGKVVPVEVKIKEPVGTEYYSISKRLIPFLVFFAVLLSGIFLTGFSMEQEKERRTLYAVLVTPTGISEVLLAKGSLGFIIGVLMSVVTLLLNGALGGEPVALILSLAVASLMFVEVGLLFASLAKDSTTLFTMMKGTGFLFMAPAFFYVFPNWPQWIAKIFPTYWIIDPIVAVTIRGEKLGDIAVSLAIALGICILLVLALAAVYMPKPLRLKRSRA